MAERDKQSGGTVVPVTPGVIARVTGAVRGAVSGWFGAGSPMSPQAPQDVAGRQFDFPYGVNLSYRPRGEPGEAAIGFDVLRRISDPTQGGLDILRLAIETRKDQMSRLKWSITGLEEDDDGGAPAKAILKELRRPDGMNPFRVWQRMLLEDHLVLDAATLYVRKGGAKPVTLEVVDGATIKRVLDDGGRTPLKGMTAYQQQLKGMPAVDYTTDELGYYPYNLRPHRIYAMSRVEQVVGIVGLALSRQLNVVEYYTEGTVPDMLVGVPESWNPDQIRQFQAFWDTVMEGNTAQKRKAKFVPGGMKPYPTKETLLKNEFDDWLARLVCYAFSLSPQQLISQINRATAETSKETAEQEGLEPLKLWFKDLMDDVLERYFGQPNLQFTWQEEESSDALDRAQVHKIYLDAGVLEPNEVREELGRDPLTPEQLEALKPAPPMVMGPDGKPQPGQKPGATPPTGAPADGADAEGGDEAKVAKASSRRVLQPVPTNHALDAHTLERLRGLAQDAMAAIASALQARLSKGDDDLLAWLMSMTRAEWEGVEPDMRKALEAMMADAGGNALRHVQDYLPGDADVSVLVDQVNELSVSWAAARSAELVTAVSETTRDLLRDAVRRGIDAGLSNAQLAATLQDEYALSDARAMLIARTETSFAENAGTLAGYRVSGVVAGKQWLVADAEYCDECAELEGEVVGLDDTFSSGDDAPPLHPNCRCTTLAVLFPEDELETA